MIENQTKQFFTKRLVIIKRYYLRDILLSNKLILKIFFATTTMIRPNKEENLNFLLSDKSSKQKCASAG